METVAISTAILSLIVSVIGLVRRRDLIEYNKRIARRTVESWQRGNLVLTTTGTAHMALVIIRNIGFAEAQEITLSGETAKLFTKPTLQNLPIAHLPPDGEYLLRALAVTQNTEADITVEWKNRDDSTERKRFPVQVFADGTRDR